MARWPPIFWWTWASTALGSCKDTVYGSSSNSESLGFKKHSSCSSDVTFQVLKVKAVGVQSYKWKCSQAALYLFLPIHRLLSCFCAQAVRPLAGVHIKETPGSHDKRILVGKYLNDTFHLPF